MKICPNCNFENAVESLFCQECGFNLPDEKSSPKKSKTNKTNSLYQKLNNKEINDVIFRPEKKKAIFSETSSSLS